METELTWNISTTNVSGLSQLSKTFTEPTAVAHSSKRMDVEIARLIQLVVRPILIITSTAGNCLSFYIMRRTSLKDVSSCFYMSLLALADTGEFLVFRLKFLIVQLCAIDGLVLLPPAYVVRREGTVFTGVCLLTFVGWGYLSEVWMVGGTQGTPG